MSSGASPKWIADVLIPWALNDEMDLPDAAPVVELIEAFRRSKAMFAAVSLGVFDRLEPAPAAAAALAQNLKVQTESLERLLDTCVSLKLLRREGALYGNEPVASTYLVRESPRALTGYILYSNDALYRMWEHLEDAIREGTPRWEQTFGQSGGIFDHFFRDEAAKQAFLDGMHGFGVLSSPKVVAAFDLSRFRCVADLGGASGHLAIAACERYPELRAVVFDLPQVVAMAQTYTGRSSARDRIQVTAGDFFHDELPAADLFAMGRILHDWSEAKIEALLTKIYQRLPSGGGILLGEKLLNDEKSGPTSAQLQSLNMLVCTEGRERSLSEYRQLLEKAGFQNVQGRFTRAPLDAIFALKP